jgi:hypothetical protein
VEINILNKFVPIRAERKNHRMIQARNVGMLILWKMREIEFLQICMSFGRQTATEKVGLATYSETAVADFSASHPASRFRIS